MRKMILGDEKEPLGESFIDILYNTITSVIGGQNSRQYFVLNMPSILINKDDFKYVIEKQKPAHVKANEAKLVNKLFDAAFIVESDNGKRLQTQYKTALNMLSPKLNKNLFEMKVKLREVLMTPYQYDFGNGIEESLTLEQVFYRLYNNYVSAKSEWNQRQLDKKAELNVMPLNDEEKKDAYLEWYALVAEAEKVILEEKMGEVLNVFSPSDMNIINGILNCSVGGELEEARNIMDMVEELTPDGGYVYPVSLYPSNWFDLLTPSFTEVDLLESPAALSQKMKDLEIQKNNMVSQLDNLVSVIPDNEMVNALHKSFEEAENKFLALEKETVCQELGVTTNVIKSIISLYTKEKKAGEEETLNPPSEEQVSRLLENSESDDNDSEVSTDKIKELIDLIGKSANECYKAQADTVEAAKKATIAALEWCKAKNNQLLEPMVRTLKNELERINSEISEIKDKIELAKAVSKPKTSNNETDVLPNNETDGFTQVLINSKISSLMNSSEKEANASTSSWGVSFFFGGYTGNKSHQDSMEKMMQKDSSMDIQIGMNIANIQIEREWFNPGVFQLSDNMYNFSDSKISPSGNIDFTSKDMSEIKKYFDEMNNCIFPSYPVAFIVAKDVTIRFSSSSSISSSFARTVEEHASQGGGFLIFSGNSSSNSESSKSAASVSSNSNSVTIRFTAPQILGYYMQVTPADKSAPINSSNEKDISVLEFATKFKEMLVEYNKSNHKITEKS